MSRAPPCRHSLQRPPGRQRPSDRDPGVPGARLGAGDGQRRRRGGRRARIPGASGGSTRGGTLCVRSPARSSARAPRGATDRRRGTTDLPQPDSRHPGRLLRPPGVDAGSHRAAPRSRGGIMSATAAIALNVFRESVRDKVLYNLVLFAIVLIAASYLIGQLTAGQDVKIIKDLGLSATSLFGLFIAVFIGIGLVSKEVERRSVYSL